MSLSTATHVNFRDQAREALAFYHSVFGGDQMVVSYGDAHVADEPADNVIFGQVVAPSGFVLMAYDVQAARGFDRGERSFYITLRGTTEEEIHGAWDGLAEGAEILEPLGPAQWGPLYGMLTDRFGVTWIISLDPGQSA